MISLILYPRSYVSYLWTYVWVPRWGWKLSLSLSLFFAGSLLLFSFFLFSCSCVQTAESRCWNGLGCESRGEKSQRWIFQRAKGFFGNGKFHDYRFDNWITIQPNIWRQSNLRNWKSHSWAWFATIFVWEVFFCNFKIFLFFQPQKKLKIFKVSNFSNAIEVGSLIRKNSKKTFGSFSKVFLLVF